MVEAVLKKINLKEVMFANISLSLSKENSNAIKTLALAFMVVDHIGAVFFPHLVFLRIIGRLAFPLFLYQLSISSEKTQHPQRYFFYLLLFALFSQFPYFLLFGLKFNILFSFLFYALFVFVLKRGYYVLLPLIFFGAIFTDAGWYGLVLMLVFVFIRGEILKMILFALLTIIVVLFEHNTIQLYSLFSIFLIAGIFLLNLRLKINRHFFYFAYLGHLLLILGVKALL